MHKSTADGVDEQRCLQPGPQLATSAARPCQAAPDVASFENTLDYLVLLALVPFAVVRVDSRQTFLLAGVLAGKVGMHAQ